MVFWLGAEEIPLLGFDPAPSLQFRHPQDHVGDISAEFPYANTCANVLSIPVLKTYDQFRQNLIASITQIKIFSDM
jgi:hypothetical protein